MQRVLFVLCVALAGVSLAGGQVRDEAESNASADAKRLAPGVWIDWARRTVEVDAHVVLREGALEFLACLAGKEHESVLRMDAAATHVYMALGLIGLTPGHPPAVRTDGGYDPPAGDLVEIRVRWTEHGTSRAADGTAWLRRVEHGRVPIERAWFFGGSQTLADGTLSSDRSGVGVAIVDFPDSLLCYSRRYPSRYGALWAEANTPAIPARGTRVRMLLRAARPRARTVLVDARGVISVDGCVCDVADLADVMLLERALEPGRIQVIAAAGTLNSDVRGLEAALERAGVTAEMYRIERQGAEEGADLPGCWRGTGPSRRPR
jgi:hypothetical protein